MPTDELESQLRSALARAAADFENLDQARQRLLQRNYHPRRGNRRLAAGITASAALVVGLAAVIAAVAHGPATKASPIAAPALRARLLAAIDNASGDILYTLAPGQPLGDGQYPAFPRPGQEVHVRIGPAVGSDGKVYKDGEYSFTMPSGTAQRNYISHTPPTSTRAGCTFPGRSWMVNHFRHIWGEWHAKFILGFTLDAAAIRAEIANGQFMVVGSTELHGQRAVELKINAPPADEAPPHVTAERMWVNATTYLPMRESPRMVQRPAERCRLRLLPAHGRESGEAAPGHPGGLHPGGPHPGDRPETAHLRINVPPEIEDEELADSAAVKRPVAGPLRRPCRRARNYRPAQLQGANRATINPSR